LEWRRKESARKKPQNQHVIRRIQGKEITNYKKKTWTRFWWEPKDRRFARGQKRTAKINLEESDELQGMPEFE